MHKFDIDLKPFTRISVLVLGDTMLDKYIYGDIERISPEAPVPVLRVSRESTMPGGAGNVARNISALGGTAYLVSVVGDDEARDALKRLLSDEGCGVVARLIVDPSRPTTIKTRYLGKSQQVLRVDSETNSKIGQTVASEVLANVRALMPEINVLCISDYAKGVLSDHVLSESIRMAHELQKPVIVDPKGKDYSVYRGATIIKPNLKELAEATGMPCSQDDEVEAAARKVIERTASAVWVTRSEKGMSLYVDGQDALHSMMPSVEVFDVSGAGDTAIAAFATSLAAGNRFEASMHLANLAASIAVTKLGTAVVSAQELNVVHSDGFFFKSADRIVSTEKAVSIARIWQSRGLKVGFTNGCFDIMHMGHIQLLRRAAADCDRLIVGLNTDASVKRLKGDSRPLQNEASRGIVMAAIEAVSLVTLFDGDTPEELIRRIRPDVLFKGADYTLDKVAGADFVQSYGGRVELIDLVPNSSTTSIISKARN